MPPMPKDPSTRQRRNRTAGARQLNAVHDVAMPALPKRAGNKKWLPQTVEWWEATWASPMAPEFDASDRHGLFLLAELIDQFWRKSSASLAAEIRLQRQCFGLTPIDRRRLQWEIDRGDEAEERTSARRQARRPKTAEADPRLTLAG